MNEPDQETDRIQSISDIQQRQDTLDGKLDKILSMLGGGEKKAHQSSETYMQERYDQSTSVADELARQLDERDRKEAARKQSADLEEWRKGVDTKLSGMGEQAPESPVRKIERVMGWR
jgi:hypothetical protein